MSTCHSSFQRDGHRPVFTSFKNVFNVWICQIFWRVRNALIFPHLCFLLLRSYLCLSLSGRSSPALVQSTVNVFFWPTKALESPAPREMTLLASEVNLGNEAKGPPIEEVFETVSTRTDDVSWRLCPPERRGPEGRCKYAFQTTITNPYFNLTIKAANKTRTLTLDRVLTDQCPKCKMFPNLLMFSTYMKCSFDREYKDDVSRENEVAIWTRFPSSPPWC